MKIEWLNADKTEAILTRGLVRKRQARVKRIVNEDVNWFSSSSWKFASGRSVEEADPELAKKLERIRWHAQKVCESDWSPVVVLEE